MRRRSFLQSSESFFDARTSRFMCRSCSSMFSVVFGGPWMVWAGVLSSSAAMDRPAHTDTPRQEKAPTHPPSSLAVLSAASASSRFCRRFASCGRGSGERVSCLVTFVAGGCRDVVTGRHACS